MDEIQQPIKRHKHKSYQQTLKEVHLPSALVQSKFDHEISDDQSHFYEALDHWRQLNLSPAFVKFASQAEGLSASLALLVHHWKDIVSLWLNSLDEADDEALRALFDLMQKLAHDLRSTIAPSYTEILQKLIRLLSKSLSAPALTALIATFSSLFKYLLVSTTEQDALKKTWQPIRESLPGRNPEVQRAMAEVWGSLLRRLKAGMRAEAVTLMAMDLEGIEDICAWAIVYACKSVSQTLHTVSSSIITPLITSHIKAQESSKTFTCIRRVLTALIHHCKSAGQFSLIADALIKEFESATQSADQEHLNRIIDVVSVACSVRQGSRLSATQLSTIVATFLAIPASLQSSHLYFATSVLTAGDMALWMGPGRKLVERSWQSESFGIKLCAALSDLRWEGWKLIELPYVLKLAPQLLDSQPKSMLEMLATLHMEKRLGDVDQKWRERVGGWMQNRLSADNILGEELPHILTLSEFLPSLSPSLVRVIDDALDTADMHENYLASPDNSTWVLASCMQALARRDSKSWADLVDLHAWTEKVLNKWYWSATVLGGLVELIEASPSHVDALRFEDVYPHLKGSVLSHSQVLRRNVLRLLESPIIRATPSEQQTVVRTHQAEEVSLDVQGVRERSVRIAKLEQVVSQNAGLDSDLAVRWLVAQLKVNLRPLWSSTAQALSSLASRFGDLIWQTIFDELRVELTSRVDDQVPEWLSEFSNEEQDLDDVWEEERTWRDPSAHKVRCAVAKWRQGIDSRRAIIRAQWSNDRFDRESYESQLLMTLGHCAALAEKHNRLLIPFFLNFADPGGLSKLPRQKLSAWLRLFSKFTNPKVLHSTDILHGLYITLLSHPDRSLQELSLSCLFTYRSAHLIPHEDTLRMLLDETRWRDELTNLDIANIRSEDRPELVNVVVRLLFGLMLERKGRVRGADRRAAVLTALGGCTDDELHLLVDLMLQHVLPESAHSLERSFTIFEISSDVSAKQQVGFLNLLGDVLKNLGSRLVSRWDSLLGATVSLIAHAQNRIDSGKQDDGEHVAEEHEDAEELQDVESIGSPKALRAVRQLGLKRFADFFRSPVSFDFLPYMSESFDSFVSPRLASLDRENTQAPSALLELFYVWTGRKESAVFLVDFDDRVLPQVYGCLIAPGVKPGVVSRVLDIIDRLLLLSSSDSKISERIIKPHVSRLLSNLSLLIERTKSDALVANPLVQRQISILSEVSHYLTDGDQAATLLALFSPLLRKSTKLVSEKVKADLLKIVCSLLPLIRDLSDRSSSTYVKTYELLSSIFQSVRTRQARVALVTAFRQLATIDVSLHPLADLVDSLNAYSSKRIEEPDFDRRIEAFTTLNGTVHASLSPSAWLPIIYNMLHFIQDPNEMAVRSNSSQALKHFVDTVASNPDSEFQVMFLRKLYPGLKNGLRSKHEMVRAEVLGVIAHAVSCCENITTLQEMRPLLAAGDEEANFFNNVHHIQLHRRTRALRRLAELCDNDHLRSVTLAEIFIPLVGNFIASTSDINHHLVNEAIITTGHMAKRLAWGPYYALVQRYLRLSKAKDASKRVCVRALVAILDNFHFPMGEIIKEEKEVEDDADRMEIDDEVLPNISETTPRESGTARIADTVNARLLPSLIHHLEKRDETEDDLRIPIAIGIVTIAQHLPSTTREPQITRLLTILSQVFRSKSQETRDLARETLCRIAIILRSSYLPLILRELRGALLRGPQLHVLSYMAHALLVHVTSAEHIDAFKNLDDCIADVAYVSAEVIFGEPGQDVQSEGFKTKMREVRSSSSKGLDSFAIIAKFITPSKISNLLIPVRRIMQETEASKAMQQVDDVLRRIASGLNSNEHLIPLELLVLCHTLISQNSRFLHHVSQPSGKRKAKGDAIVQLKRDMATATDHYATNSFRFVVFGLDLLNTALRRGRFKFDDAAIISRLESIVPVIGNTLYSNNSHVLVQGLKAAASISKCPLKNIGKSLPVFIRQIISIVKQTGSTESEVTQMAFKILASIIRDQPTAQVKEMDLIYILELLSPDLEEPSRQAAVFTMLRAIVARKFVVPEIYDLMDKVSEVMVTSQSSQVQELCRGVLLQFLLEYPQGKGRLRNQMTFLAKNLSYIYESGRQSVMEVLSAIILKFDGALISEYADMMFVALVMVIANDDSSKCREMAAEIVKRLFGRLDVGHRRIIMSHLHSWASQGDRPQLSRVATQVYGYTIDILQLEATPFLSAILEDLDAILNRSAQQFDSGGDGDEDDMDVDVDWQVSYHVLTVLNKVLRVFPDVAAQSQKISRSSVVAHLLFPHAWVRTASSRLLGTLFSASPVTGPVHGSFPDGPLAGLDIKDVANKLCLQLRSPHLDAALNLQVVKNLFYVGKCFVAIPTDPMQHTGTETADDDTDNEVDDDGEDQDQEMETRRRQENPLAWIFSKLSYQARSAHIARRNRSSTSDNWFHQPSAIFRWFAAMVTYMEAPVVELFLVHILSPLYRITEDDTIRDPHMDELKATAVELQELVQQKVGTTKFAQVYSKLRQSMLKVQRERRTARITKATTNPQAAAHRKIQRGASKKDSRKRKNSMFMESKGRMKRRRSD